MRRYVMAVVLGTLLVPSGLALAATSGTWRGRTSQHRKVVIHVQAGYVEKSSEIRWVAPCNRGKLHGATRFYGALHSGRYTVTSTYSDNVKGGYTSTNTAHMTFKIHGRKIKGTFHVTSVVYSGATPVANCSSPTVRFKAKR